MNIMEYYELWCEKWEADLAGCEDSAVKAQQAEQPGECQTQVET